VNPIDALVRKLPNRAEAIVRIYWRDPVFRTVCEDLRDASEVLERLEGAKSPDTARIREYRDLVAELLAEATGMLPRGNEQLDP
jgi:hypothetical protein